MSKQNGIVVVVDGISYPVPDAATAEKVAVALLVAAERHDFDGVDVYGDVA